MTLICLRCFRRKENREDRTCRRGPTTVNEDNALTGHWVTLGRQGGGRLMSQETGLEQ
ncbi:hypothetical protein SAMN06296020_10464 [Anoxynatronum buryatiense]|uniref:Uncharacterized protein n=1 Tax=Anoxynatronum buryatiense TaxID=489973 RepID=A0AA46AIJ7_9CLOT|nr:hypothetical protein SAMN06296020_10464 [Anoxynatronum buryatiense]